MFKKKYLIQKSGRWGKLASLGRPLARYAQCVFTRAVWSVASIVHAFTPGHLRIPATRAESGASNNLYHRIYTRGFLPVFAAYICCLF